MSFSRMIWAAGLLAVVSAVYAFQWRRGFGSRESQGYEWEMQNPADDPADAAEPGEYTFARLRYRSFGGRRRGGAWGTDANKAERVFVQGVRRLSRVSARSVEKIVDVDSNDMFDYPWLYAVEVGNWELSEEQAKKLRDYLDRGGFLMVDDFHGLRQWMVFEESLRRIFPDRPVVDLPDTSPIFHILYDLEQRHQVPGRQYVWTGRTYEQPDDPEARWRGVLDEQGRVQVAICYNSDLGDAWEWADDPQYPEAYASLAYRIGLNYVVYAMTH